VNDPIDRTLIEAAREEWSPSDAERDRLRRAVLASVAAGTAAGASATAAASAKGAGVVAATWSGWKIAMVAVAVTTAVGGAAWTAVSVREEAPAPSRVERIAAPEPEPRPASPAPVAPPSEPPSIEEPPPPVEVAAAEPTPEPSRPVRGRAIAVPAEAHAEEHVENASPAAALLRETALLRDAHRALRTGQADQALALLDRHAREHPDGVLREERLATRVLALCEAGRDEQARAEAARFLAAHPRSMHATRVRASCAAP
jgi:type IV secretory pathway VirB10-like protein